MGIVGVALATTTHAQNIDVLKSRLKPLPQYSFFHQIIITYKKWTNSNCTAPILLKPTSPLAELFPNCVIEMRDAQGGRSGFSHDCQELKKAIDFDLLKQELSGSIVDGPQEHYQLNWPGMREALLTANAPIAKTLRPCREESVDFDSTQNLFIEGDNLDALKLLQETYLGKVKMI